MTEAVFTYYPTSRPDMEIFDVTTIPTNGLTLTSRKFSAPLAVAIIPTSTVTSNDGVYNSSTSGAVVTLGVYGAGYKCRVILMANV